MRAEVKAFLDRCQKNAAQGPIDTLVFGCTHFPLVSAQFLKVLTEESQTHPGLLASDVSLVDPAATTAQELYQTLTAKKLWATHPAATADRFFMSVANPHVAGVQLDDTGGLSAAYKYSRTAGDPGREDTIVAPLRADNLPTSSAALVRDHLALTWADLKTQP